MQTYTHTHLYLHKAHSTGKGGRYSDARGTLFARITHVMVGSYWSRHSGGRRAFSQKGCAGGSTPNGGSASDRWCASNGGCALGIMSHRRKSSNPGSTLNDNHRNLHAHVYHYVQILCGQDIHRRAASMTGGALCGTSHAAS